MLLLLLDDTFGFVTGTLVQMHQLVYLREHLFAFFTFNGQILASVRQTQFSAIATDSVQLFVSYELFAVDIYSVTERVEANALENQVFEHGLIFWIFGLSIMHLRNRQQ